MHMHLFNELNSYNFSALTIKPITICIENAPHVYYFVILGKLANENAITHLLLPCSTKMCNTAMIG